MEDRTRERAEPLDRSSAEESVLGAPSISGEPMRGEDLADRERGRRCGVDHANVAARDLLDRGAQQGVMGAPEKERVDDGLDDAAAAASLAAATARLAPAAAATTRMLRSRLTLFRW